MPAPRLLVSVRDAREALEAAAGGAHLIDAKDPSRGALGPVGGETLEAILRACPSHLQTSAALGDLAGDEPAGPFTAGRPARGSLRPTFLKVGTGGVDSAPAAQRALARFMEQVAGDACRWIVAAYADHARMRAPSPLQVPEVALRARAAGCLLDTAIKDGSSLLDWMAEEDLARFIGACRERRLLCALAGSLQARHLERLAPLGPDFIGVRGAACEGGDRRRGSVTAARVAALARTLPG
jgi:hypothetical protein